MRGILFSLLFVGLVGWGMPSAADSPTDVLSGCLVDSLNGKERKAFANYADLEKVNAVLSGK